MRVQCSLHIYESQHNIVTDADITVLEALAQNILTT